MKINSIKDYNEVQILSYNVNFQFLKDFHKDLWIFFNKDLQSNALESFSTERLKKSWQIFVEIYIAYT